MVFCFLENYKKIFSWFVRMYVMRSLGVDFIRYFKIKGFIDN